MRRRNLSRILNLFASTNHSQRIWQATRLNCSKNFNLQSVKRFPSSSLSLRRASFCLFFRSVSHLLRCSSERSRSTQPSKPTMFRFLKMRVLKFESLHRQTSSVASFKTLSASSLTISFNRKSRVSTTGTRRIVTCISMNWQHSRLSRYSWRTLKSSLANSHPSKYSTRFTCVAVKKRKMTSALLF